MTEWYCNHCGTKVEIADVDTMYLEFDGMEECMVCNTCKDWWFDEKVIKRIIKGEADCQAKMA